MTRYYAVNLGETSINETAGIESGVLEFDVTDASKLPTNVPFKITVDNEIMDVTGIISNTLTVVRAREGTSAAYHANGAIVSNNPTAGVWDELWDDFDAHTGSGGSSHDVATGSVNGFMSASDKDKLDGIPDNANNYSHPEPPQCTTSQIAEIAGSKSASLDTGGVTNSHLRQVNVSYNSTASEGASQVNASTACVAEGFESQVNASAECVAEGFESQVNASWLCNASQTDSQVNASVRCNVTESCAQVNASNRVTNNEMYSVAGGHSVDGDASTANRTWHIFSNTGNIQIAGAVSSSHTFTDYGEYFPNLTGIEIPVGTPVVVDGYGVRPVQAGDDIDGVVSATAALRLGDTPFTWQGRYLKDEWGRILLQDIEVSDREGNPKTVTVPVENTDYDPSLENIPRSERKDEWTLVGLFGQVYMRVDKDVVIGDYLVSGTNIATTSPTKTNIKVMLLTTVDPERDYNIAYCFMK